MQAICAHMVLAKRQADVSGRRIAWHYSATFTGPRPGRDAPALRGSLETARLRRPPD